VYDIVKRARPLAKIREFNANNKPLGDSVEEQKYVDMGSQWWWQARLAFEQKLVGFSMAEPDAVDELINELNQAKYGYLGPAKLKVNKFGLRVTQGEATMGIEERAQRSPDRADSFVLALNAALPSIGRKGEQVRETVWHQGRPGAINA
jgi:hypothetical protein